MSGQVARICLRQPAVCRNSAVSLPRRHRLARPAKSGKTLVIPQRVTRQSLREYDRHLDKAQDLIKNFFTRLRQYRAVATR
jgi:hypothetical protein